MQQTDLTESKLISEIFLALHGEPCILTNLKVSQLEFRANENFIKEHMPSNLALEMKKIVETSSYVRFIEFFKNNDSCIHKTDVAVSELPLDPKQIVAEESHPIKRAIVESILDDYGHYQKTINHMRAEHISLRRIKTLNELLTFTHIWCKRLRFIRSLFSLIGAKDGMQLMSYIYQESNLLCHLDWEYSLLMNALTRSSIELNFICSKWLLDAQFSSQISWMIKVEKKPLNPSNSSNNFDTSVTSLQSVEVDLSQQNANKSEPTMDDFYNYLTLAVTVQIENIPETFFNCKELLEMIMDIGKKVHFLKILRSSRFYEYAREERLEIIKRLVIPSIWYDPSHRASLCIALHKLNSFICEDMRVELFINHRMIDHISLVHAYFFMLRGDLFAELERLTRISFVNPTIYYHTPKSLRKRSTLTMKKIEDILNNALNFCVPPQNSNDLIILLSSEKCRDRTKTFLELFGLNFSTTNKKLNDDFQSSSNPMGEFFSKQVMKIYRKVFYLVSNFQMLRFQLDELAFRFQNNVIRKLWRQKSNIQFPSRLIFGILYKLRLFLARLGNYIFDEVLILQSTSILKTVQSSQDPYSLINRHQNLLNRVLRSLFIYFDAAPIHTIFMKSIRDARFLLFETRLNYYLLF
ncbi:GCP_C_terminal domain-containing protein [Meloidogyne graminicola]|uniref:Gamma-tubulin complex component n=1 Tax=Meloidogyne graminicola TaxID=189291 RepID=A0A8T0A0Y4_9BILA|nr:GCP_C_terminal domain-containing protein [Meloidogyne graminicola]